MVEGAGHMRRCLVWAPSPDGGGMIQRKRPGHRCPGLLSVWTGLALAAATQAAQQHGQTGDDTGGQQGLAAGEVQSLASLVLILDRGFLNEAVQAVDDAAIGVQSLALDLVQPAFGLQTIVAGQATDAILDPAADSVGGAFDTLVGHGEILSNEWVPGRRAVIAHW